MYTEWIRELAVEDVAVKEAMDPAQVVESAMLSRQKGMVEGIARGDSPIQRYYDGATIFVTGGSGFLGKQLVEKLFRACNIKKIFLLLRPKKGMEVQDRLKEILEDPVYSSLLQQQPTFPSRITCVQGDVSETRLGLSDQDWNTVASQVDMIFHVAATTRFDESLRVATLINVRGTREAIRLGKDCQKLRSFVYVSTAYSHATSDKIEQPVQEQFYQSPIPPETLIKMVESVDGAVLERMASKLTAGWPNTYTFAKAVAEEQVRLTAAGMPVCIVRPSIVISAHYEPAPGWIDISSARSASGFVIGSGLGLLHVMQTTPSTDLSLVPVDYVNNAIIAAGWEVGTRQGESERKMYTRQGESETTIYTKQGESEREIYTRQGESERKICTKQGESETKIYRRQQEIDESEKIYMTQEKEEGSERKMYRRQEEGEESETTIYPRQEESEEREMKIYNVVMSQENKLTWELLRSYCMEIRTELPMPSAVYLAYVFCVRSYYSFLLLTVLLHFIPACAADAVMMIMGRERKFFKIYKKMFKLSVSLSYFLNTTYYLDGKNTEGLFEKLSTIDKRIFFFDMRSIDWYEFSQVWCIGIRKYIVKDGLKNTEFAKRKQFWFKYVNYVVLSLYVCAIWFVLCNVCKVLGSVLLSMVNL